MKNMMISSIRGYQKVLSPLKPPTCRFYPSCSHYGIEAIEKHGALRGGYLTARRLMRCQPFHPGGLDYVPDTFDWRAPVQSQRPGDVETDEK